MKSKTTQRKIVELTAHNKSQASTEDSEVLDVGADRWLRRPAAAQHLGISPSLLEKLDALGDGPPCARIGRVRIYRRSGLDTYAKDRLAKTHVT